MICWDFLIKKLVNYLSCLERKWFCTKCCAICFSIIKALLTFSITISQFSFQFNLGKTQNTIFQIIYLMRKNYTTYIYLHLILSICEPQRPRIGLWKFISALNQFDKWFVLIKSSKKRNITKIIINIFSMLLAKPTNRIVKNISKWV